MARRIYGRADTVGFQVATLCLVVEYVLYPPRVPVKFSKWGCASRSKRSRVSVSCREN